MLHLLTIYLGDIVALFLVGAAGFSLAIVLCEAADARQREAERQQRLQRERDDLHARHRAQAPLYRRLSGIEF